MKIPRLKCNRCLHEWFPRREVKPKVCSKCKRKDYNKPRKGEVDADSQITNP